MPQAMASKTTDRNVPGGIEGNSAGAGGRLHARLRSVPPEAIIVGLGLFVLFAIFAAADPNGQVTFSGAPFTDEAFNVVNARNLVQLGRWSTDEWNLHLVNLPFSLLEVATFKLLGVGIVQARLAMIVCVSLTATALVWGLRGVVGRSLAVFAGLAFACSSLILFYGRLAFLEDLVVLGLTLGVLTLANARWLNLRGGLLAGACFAVAIGTKPSAIFSVVGILVLIGLVWGFRSPNLRAWLIGAVAIIAVAGVVWSLAIWLPNRDAIAQDLKIWPPFKWNLTPVALFDSVKSYLTVVRANDHILTLLLLPLIGLGSMGMLAIVTLRKRLSDAETRLALAAFAWAAFGFAILMLVSYRPNRYVVPLVPSLAILAAIGLRVGISWLQDRFAVLGKSTDGVSDAAQATDPATDPVPATTGPRYSPLSGVLLALAVIVAVGPGLFSYATWMQGATYDLVAIQSQFAAAAPQGQTVAGPASALFLMRSKATTTVVGLANDGDLYAQGTRLYLLTRDAAKPTGVPPAVWTARREIMCADWRGHICLYSVK